MQLDRIASLLAPFLPPPGLSQSQLQSVSNHLDLLLQWNSKINLTSVRSPEEIVARHFGESFFLAHVLFPPGQLRASQSPLPDPQSLIPNPPDEPIQYIDVGSGAGFPGLPLKLYVPNLQVTLIESQNKKATFLKEVVRKNRLMNIDIFSGRAESFTAALSASASARPAALVTMRAVERFAQVLPIAARLLSPGGRLALLIGSSQLPRVHELLPSAAWRPPVPIPLSRSRVLLISEP